MISAALAELIRLAIHAHNQVHDGTFLECEDELCDEIREEAIETILLEVSLERVRAAA
jgi:hypothetical protein